MYKEYRRPAGRRYSLYLLNDSFGKFTPTIILFACDQRVALSALCVDKARAAEPCPISDIRSVMLFREFHRFGIGIRIDNIAGGHRLAERFDLVLCHCSRLFSRILYHKYYKLSIFMQKKTSGSPKKRSRMYFYRIIYQSTREMIAISAASPRRGPILTILV